MKILIFSEKEFFKKLGPIRHNLKKHTGIFQTTEIGKINNGLFKEKIIFDKDIQLLKEFDAFLRCNFKKGKEENHIGANSLMILSIAYSLKKKIYLLYDLPNKYVDILKSLEVLTINGDLKKIM
jgi:hypothetical protein